MSERTAIYKAFDSYKITYAITNPNGKDYARIDFFNGDIKVGQVLMGDAIAPGSYANLLGEEIHLYFGLSHFESIVGLLQRESGLALYVELEEGGHPTAKPIGGIITRHQ
jgi:hypothetical protein